MTRIRFLEPWSFEQGAARAAEGFRAQFGAEPTGVWAAPGRVNLIGEHTDYNGGLSAPIALAHRTFFAAARAGDDRCRLSSTMSPGQVVETPMAAVAPGSVSGWSAYAVGVVWALRRRAIPAPALTGHVDSRVPLGAGLSSSAALEAAVALAAVDLGYPSDAVPRVPAGRALLAAACVEAENRIAGAPTGGMDQAAALLAAPGQALAVDSASGQTELVPFDLDGAGLELLVIDTRVKHALVDGQYGQRRATCAEAARVLGVETLAQVPAGDLDAALEQLGGPETVAARRVRHVVTEIDRARRFVAALRAGALAEVGPLLDASHASLRDDYQVSAPELDLAVAESRAAGALGARMTGGGFGGSAIALIRRGQAPAVAGAVALAFAAQGLKEPVFLLARASGGARRVL
ncbi:MAG: galactokinase [Bifidobacteriaceae bacterium]|jgi:galactokinase|nr:galactokinase [Bifidobacteriaceae bacterium]